MELAVAMALMIILLAVSVRGLVGYYQYTQQKKQDERAQAVYLAAQTELTRRFQDGGAREIERIFSEAEPMEPGQCACEESFPKGVYCLEARGSGGGVRGDYERYQRGELRQENREDEKIRLLYELIEPQIWDKSVLEEGTIHLEIYLPDGLIYSSYYSSDYPQGFGGKEMLALQREAGKGTDAIGYYGVDSLPEPAPEQGERPRLRGLRMSQQAGLTLSWKVDGKCINTWKALTYEITFYGGKKGQEMLGRIVLNSQPGTERAAGGGYAEVPRHLSSLETSGGYQSIQGIGIFNAVPEWYKFHIQLDEYDYQITLLLDERGFWETEDQDREEQGEGELISLTQKGASPAQAVASFSQANHSVAKRNTRKEAPYFSLFSRLGQEGWDPELLEQLSCTINAYGKGDGIAAVKESNWICLLFQEED